MDHCQSGLHDRKSKGSLRKFPVVSGKDALLCEPCLSKIVQAQKQGTDLTMTILYNWTKEFGDVSQMPVILLENCMKRCSLVQFVNQQLFNVRFTNKNFPVILLPEEREGFIRILEEDKDVIKSILYDLQNSIERRNITLKIWTGCISAAKGCRSTYVAERNPDGTTKKECLYTPDMRAVAFNEVLTISKKDSVYEAGVEAAPVWELIVNHENHKKMYLDGIPNLSDSPITKYVKDRNKTIISADDIDLNK
jgi:hypothetical protein